jgi:hypothetical protein
MWCAKRESELLKALTYLLGDVRTALDLALVKGRVDYAARWLETLAEDARRARELLAVEPLPSLSGAEREFVRSALNAVGEIDAALSTLLILGLARGAGSWLSEAERSIGYAKEALARIPEKRERPEGGEWE